MPKKFVLDRRQPTLFNVPKSAPILVPVPVKKVDDPIIVQETVRTLEWKIAQWERHMSPLWRREKFPEYAEFERTLRRNGFIEEADLFWKMIIPFGPQ